MVFVQYDPCPCWLRSPLLLHYDASFTTAAGLNNVTNIEQTNKNKNKNRKSLCVCHTLIGDIAIDNYNITHTLPEVDTAYITPLPLLYFIILFVSPYYRQTKIRSTLSREDLKLVSLYKVTRWHMTSIALGWEEDLIYENNGPRWIEEHTQT